METVATLTQGIGSGVRFSKGKLLLIQERGLFHGKGKILFLLAYGLSAMVIPGGLLNRLLPPHSVWGREYSLMVLWFSFPFYGFLLLFLCILLCYHRLMKWQKSASTEPLRS